VYGCAVGGSRERKTTAGAGARIRAWTRVTAAVSKCGCVRSDHGEPRVISADERLWEAREM
jgi:hypothetical protein